MFGEGGVRFLQVLGFFFYIFCNTCFGEKDISFLLISHTALLLMQQHIPVIKYVWFFFCLCNCYITYEKDNEQWYVFISKCTCA